MSLKADLSVPATNSWVTGVIDQHARAADGDDVLVEVGHRVGVLEQEGTGREDHSGTAGAHLAQAKRGAKPLHAVADAPFPWASATAAMRNP